MFRCLHLGLAAAIGLATPVLGGVQLGSEVLAADQFRALSGKRVGLITNPSGVNRSGETTIDLLRDAPGVDLAALFAPEHGLSGKVKAGDPVESSVDPRTGLPVHSLYGSTRKPTPAMLEGLDALVYDLQDIGLRPYTFISTMGLAMEACAEAGVEFVVLDRPNPLDGVRVEGPRLEEAYRSFVSQWDVPIIYGLTCGELAQMINGEGWIKKRCKLVVIPMRGWHRRMTWHDTGLAWVPPSPNIRRADTPFGCAATGLLGEIGGGSGLSIGGAFNRIFECVLAPWIDARRFSQRLQSYQLPGVNFPTLTATTDQKTYHGVELRFTRPAEAPLLALNFYFLDAIARTARRNLVQEAVRNHKNLQMFDKVNGTDATRRALIAGRTPAEIVRSWTPGEDAFRKQRRPYLLYPEVPAPALAAGKNPPPAPFPSPPANASSRAPRQYTNVTLSRGDTIYKIAGDYGVTVGAIVEANPGLDVAHVKVGQKIRVPRHEP